MDLGNTLQSFAVLQRNKQNVSEHYFSGTAENSGDLLLTVKTADGSIVEGFDKIVVGQAVNARVKGLIAGLPVGGAYKIILQIAQSQEKAVFKDVLVGDLWLLAGQSNMADYGVLPSLSKPDPMVHAFYMVNQWDIACDPLHDTDRAAAPVHGGEVDAQPKTVKGRGAGPGLAFGLKMYKSTGVPQGLIACAHGGTTLDQWDPALKKLGGNSLYGAMYERLRDLGGKVAGLLWYQGCSDTSSASSVDMYTAKTRKVFNAVRRDCADSDLPIVFVQLAAFVTDPSYPVPAKHWLMVRNSQYVLGQKMKNTICVPAIDLALADHIHLSNQGVKTLGERMAEAMQSLREPENHPPQIKVKKIRCLRDFATSNARVEITFDNVCGKLKTCGDTPCGFSLVDSEGNFVSEAISCELAGNQVRVLLKISSLFFNENYQIAYGGNLQPHANIVDEANRSLPCFVLKGSQRPKNMSAFVSSALVSNAIYGSDDLDKLNYPEAQELAKLSFTPATVSQIYLLAPVPEAGHSPKEPRKYFYKFYLDLPEAMELKMLFGADAPFAVYCDKRELLHQYTVNPVVLDEFSHTFQLSAGKHEFFVVFSSNSGKGWGYCCRFVRKDGKILPTLLTI